MKRIMILLLTLSLALSVTGCTKPVNVPIADIVAEVTEAIRADLVASGAFTEQDLEEGLPGLRGSDLLEEEANFQLSDPELFDGKLISEGYILAPIFNVMSDEVILLRAKDRGAVKELQAALEQEKENRLQQWESYLPDQYEKVKNTIIKVQGQYLLYATWEDPAIIEAAFAKALGK